MVESSSTASSLPCIKRTLDSEDEYMSIDQLQELLDVGEISDETLTWWPDQGDNWNVLRNLPGIRPHVIIYTNRRSAWMIINRS